MKYIYLIGALAFALGVSSCKKDEPQSSATVQPSPSEKTKVLTASHWSVEGTSEDGLETQLLALDFRPDGTYTVTYRKATGTARSLRAQTARAISWEVYSFSGKYNLENDKLTILSIEYDRAEGVAADSPKIEEMKDFAQSLVGRVFRLNEEERTLTLTDEKPSPTAGEVTGPFRLFILHPATATEPTVPTRESAPRELLDFYWTGDYIEDNTGRTRRSYEFINDSVYILRMHTEHFEPIDSGKASGSRDLEYYIRGYYTYRNDTIFRLGEVFDHYGENTKEQLEPGWEERISEGPLSPMLIDWKQGRMALIVDKPYYDEQGILQTKTGEIFAKTPKSFSLTSGAWVFDDSGETTDSQGQTNYTAKTTSLTLYPDQTFKLHFLRSTGGVEKENPAPGYNDEYSYSGRYTYSNGKLTLLTSQFDGYAQRFVAERRRHPQPESSIRIDGLVFRVNETRGAMQPSYTDSYGPGRQVTTDSPLEDQPYYLQLIGGDR